VGTVTVKRVPCPTSLSTLIEPWCASRIALVIERPRPVPWIFAAAFVRKKRVNSRCWSSGVMPIPESATTIMASSPTIEIESPTRPPGGVNLIAFEMRLSKTWASRTRSALTVGVRTQSNSSATSAAAARGRASMIASPATAARSTSSIATSSLPAFTCATNRRSLMRRNRRVLFRPTAESIVRCSSFNSPAVPSSTSSV